MRWQKISYQEVFSLKFLTYQLFWKNPLVQLVFQILEKNLEILDENTIGKTRQNFLKTKNLVGFAEYFNNFFVWQNKTLDSNGY